jgi:hypothetical protein
VVAPADGRDDLAALDESDDDGERGEGMSTPLVWYVNDGRRSVLATSAAPASTCTAR